MVNTIRNYKATLDLSENFGKALLMLSGGFLCIVGLTIFQDFLESVRNSSAFYFNESILFKTVWFLFIPMLAVLYKKLKNETSYSHTKTAIFIVSPIIVHLFILPFVCMVFSFLFYESRYDLYKFFSYTLAHDLYKLVVIYTTFVLGHILSRNTYITESKPALNTIVVNNGKDNTILNVADILQITSATPYIIIHLENKRHLYSQTLKSICNQLDNDVFVRVHKSSVVNISKVSSFKSRLNGDYDLQLTNGELVRLSRTYASNFKNHFNTSHQVNL
ncbi:LytTR family DNA-binding domain-containing protein [uncultured Roseivirga sp.]|uniref:LytR/AlgR family response regulator transcription factor n=1 Tax=uncultured Roseivirga sp. TaxID=543088 RepID=UPI0030DBDAEB|tara:strand:- start:58 stop:885 length:828 start_codon:yes stop_codon:yes gene_type:complete